MILDQVFLVLQGELILLFIGYQQNLWWPNSRSSAAERIMYVEGQRAAQTNRRRSKQLQSKEA
jgi:hypothetical protein